MDIREKEVNDSYTYEYQDRKDIPDSLKEVIQLAGDLPKQNLALFEPYCLVSLAWESLEIIFPKTPSLKPLPSTSWEPTKTSEKQSKPLTV